MTSGSFSRVVRVGLLLFYAQHSAIADSVSSPPPLPQNSMVRSSAELDRPVQDHSYVLGPSDVVHSEALSHPDFNVQARIEADGTIQLPYVGSIVAANMTTSSLRRQISSELKNKGIFSDVTLVVDVVSFASRYVTVLGGVSAPGLIPIDRVYHLSEILARAGGVRVGGADYVILRSLDGGERQLSIKELATGDSTSDPVVSPGDKIYVPTDVFYIKGQIKAPGSYPLSLDMTLAMALARGGGLTTIGSEKSIIITRRNFEIEPRDLNFRVLPDDVIEVGESWF